MKVCVWCANDAHPKAYPIPKANASFNVCIWCGVKCSVDEWHGPHHCCQGCFHTELGTARLNQKGGLRHVFQEAMGSSLTRMKEIHIG
eukprot:804162-Pelagomonas_calceolata.AAC.3